MMEKTDIFGGEKRTNRLSRNKDQGKEKKRLEALLLWKLVGKCMSGRVVWAALSFGFASIDFQPMTYYQLHETCAEYDG